MPLPQRRWFLMGLIFMGLLLIGGGIWLFRTQQAALRADAEADLAAIAELKADQIAQWCAERLGDAAVIMDSRSLIEGITRWLADQRPEDAEGILARFRDLQAGYGYDDILLVDAAGQVRLRLSEQDIPLAPEALETVQQAWAERRPLMVDLHVDARGGQPHTGTVAPLFDEDGAPLAAILLQMNAESFLYPLLETWPLPSESAETLIVRQEGDGIVFLNELRHQPGAPLTLRIPLSEMGDVAVMAGQGRQGVWEGVDYRGVPVVSAIRSIPNSPWYLIAKIDRAEIYAPWQRYATVLGGFLVALLTALGAGGAAFWQGRERKYYEDLAHSQAALQASEDRYRATLLSVGDGIIVTDAQGRIEIMNAVAEELTGWPQEEALGRPLEEVFRIVNEETRRLVESPAARVLQEGRIVGLANHTVLLGRDGVERPIADSGAPVRDASGQTKGVVLVFRDQSEERAAQRALAESERTLSTLMANLPGMAYRCAHDTAWTMEFVSQGVQALTGYAAEDFLGNARFTYADIIHPDDRAMVREATQAAVAEGRSFVLEYRIVTADGSIKWVWEQGRAVPNGEGELSTLEGFIMDITERKEAGEALAQERLLLRTVIDHLPDAVYVKDVHGRKLLANAVDVRNMGLSDEAEALGKTDADVYGSELARSFMADDRIVLEQGEPILEHQDYLVDADGQEHWGLTTKLPLRDAQGNIVGLVGISRDITERRQQERHRALQALRIETLLRLHELAEASQNEILDYVLDACLRITESERAFIGFVNEEGSDLSARFCVKEVGESCEAALEWHDYVDEAGLWAECVRQREAVICNDYGEAQPAEKGFGQGHAPLRRVLCVPIFEDERVALAGVANKRSAYDEEDSSALTALMNKLWEILRRREYEARLRESEERYRRLAENAPDLIFRYRLLPEPGMEYINAAVETITGYSPEECYADPLLMMRLVHPEDAPGMAELFFNQTIPSEPLFMRWIGKDGVARWMETRVIPVYNEEGQLSAVEGITRDMTERVHEEEERQRLEQHLQDMQKIEAVGRLAGGVAHDFNNMLQTILGYTELAIQDAPKGSPLQEYLAEIRAAGQRSAALTHQLLAFARRQTIRPQALNLNEHVPNTLKMLGRLIGENIRLEWRPAPSPAWVVMDPAQVDQVLANLILNARDAIEDVGEVIIEIELVTLSHEDTALHPEAGLGDYVVLSVSDTGRGMDAEVQSHLFEPFFTTKPVGEGTGLGLATIYGIVRQNEGFITVDSEVGQGTTFYIYLPRQEAPAELSSGEEEAIALPRGTETVLLVEDEQSLLRLAARQLTELGYTVLSASSPEAARRLAREHPGEIHLLMTDVIMPGMNGRDLAEVIRAQRPGIRCLYMSGYTANVIAQRGGADENVAFLQKPFAIETLARQVRIALGEGHTG